VDGGRSVLIRKINLTAGIKRAPKFIHDDYVRAVTYSNDGKYITTGDDVKKVIVRDAVTGETEYEFKVPGWIYSLCYLDNGDLAVGLRNGVV
jgi:WD40 repeat protein